MDIPRTARPRGRTRAVTEALVLLCCTLGAVGLVHNSPIGAWQRKLTVFAFAENAVMLIVALLWLLAAGRKFAAYGLSTVDFKSQIHAAVTCGIPFSALAFLSFVNWGRFVVAIQMAVGIAVLFMFGFLLRKQSPPTSATVPCLLVTFNQHGMQHAATGLVFYLIFLGPSEEVLFRGVIQSRLNAAFGRPFIFFGARWGCGTVIACLIFGLAHVVNPYALYQGQWHPNWWAGPVTFCIALPLAFLRERTGGVLAPAILHALPQGIARAIAAMS